MKRTSLRAILAHAPMAIKGRPIAETVNEERKERSSSLNRGTKLTPTGNKRRRRFSRDKESELSPEFLRELRRRVADTKDPLRYVVFSDISRRPPWKLWLDVSNDVYGMSIDQATLFKRKHVAQAIARSCSSGRRDHLSVARITTKNGKRRVLKIEKI